MSSGRDNTFVVLFVLIAASVASASPTVFSDCPSHPVSVKADNTSNNSACNLDSVVVNDQVSELGKAIFQPPLVDNRKASGDNQYLPAVPPALFMVLTGFLCVSLVRDRKTWIAVLAGLLWLGQAGFNALPELTSRLSQKIHNSSPVKPELIAAYPLDGVYFPESFNEQIRYTGLLHHLEGIPRQKNAFSHIRQVALSGCPSSLRYAEASGYAARDVVRNVSRVVRGKSQYAKRTTQYAIASPLSLLNTLCDCLDRPTGQFVCFKPAFIFSNLSRGPPIS